MNTVIHLLTVLLSSWSERSKRTHGTPVRKMYVDEIDQESLTLERLINLILTEFVHRQIQQLEKQETCEKTNSDLCTKFRECCHVLDEDERWLNYADKAISRIEREDIYGREF